MKKLLLTILTMSSLVLFAQQKGPQTLAQLEESPAGSKILDYLSVLGDNSELSDSWIKELFAPKLIKSAGIKGLKEMVAEIRQTDGQLQLYEVDRAGMFEYKLRVLGLKSKEWMDMVFTFEQEEPYRISGITLDTTDEGSVSTPMFPKN